jgi:hypothetical protein
MDFFESEVGSAYIGFFRAWEAQECVKFLQG